MYHIQALVRLFGRDS